MARRALLVALGFGLVGGLSLLCASAWAITYQCVDATGNAIFTDSPLQLKACALRPTWAEVRWFKGLPFHRNGVYFVGLKFLL
jgi:hypothetical protein